MAHIEFKDVSVAFPIFNAESRSLKNKVLSISSGGRLGQDENGVAEIRALDDINFVFKNGERIGLVGHNGSGKSTLLRTLSGVYWPQRGLISIKGKTTSLIDISLGINPEFTGRENILIRGSLLGLTRDQIRMRTDEIIHFTELGEFIDMPLRTYSSGMQLRLAFAISTTNDPEILLMDEWLSVGDENFKGKAEERMQHLADKSNILVIASHSAEQILKVCSRVLWLEHGRIKMDGDPKTVCGAYFG
jgi:lipopolysaccharide transport system ATP-binding protein